MLYRILQMLRYGDFFSWSFAIAAVAISCKTLKIWKAKFCILEAARDSGEQDLH